MSEILVSHDRLSALCVGKLLNAGVPLNDAESVADVLVHADLRGVHSHGVMRMEHYLKKLAAKGINPKPNVTIKLTGPCSALVDGDDGFGHIITKQGMEYAIELAEQQGIGMVGITNSSHCGALSYFVRQAAEKNMIGFAFANADKVVVPFGGAKALLGTNPLAFGIPSKSNRPLILDMATSEVALGKVLHAKTMGQSIPDNWGIDAQGKPTTDPNQVTALLPYGGPKGYGLALIVDILSGILTGSAFGPYIPHYQEYAAKRKLGHFIGAVNISYFSNISSFMDNIDTLIRDIHASPPAEGFAKVMIPGEPEMLKEEERLLNGIPISESLYKFLET